MDKLRSLTLNRTVQRLDERVGPLVLPIALACLGLAMVVMHLSRSYTSDDTAPLVMVQQWLQGHHHVAYFGSDTYIMKFPLYWLIQILLPHSRTAILLIILVVNLIGAWLFIVATRYFLKKFKIYSPTVFLISLVWLTTLGSPFLVILMNPQTRNLEIGIAFFLIMLLDRLIFGREESLTPQRWAQLAATILLAGLLLYDDPYFLLTLFVPALLMLAWNLWRQPRDRRVWLAIVAMGGSYAVFKVLTSLFLHLGIVANTGEAQFISVSQLLPMLVSLLDNTLSLFRANFFGLAFYSKYVLEAAVSLIVLLVITWQVWTYRRTQALQRFPGILVFAIAAPVVAAAFVLSSYSDPNATRYLILLPFLGVLFLNMAYAVLGSEKQRIALLVVILLAILLNGFIMVRDGYRALRTIHPNAIDRTVIDAARAAGITKGYAQYWSANIATYLSSGNPTIISVQCSGAITEPYYWLMDSAELDQPAHSSFYLYQTDPAKTGCSMKDLVAEFGQPGRIVQIDAQDQMLVYPYDLKDRMLR